MLSGIGSTKPSFLSKRVCSFASLCPSPLIINAEVAAELQTAIAWSGTADAWSKRSREFLCVNGFYIDKKWVLRRVSFGVKRMEIEPEKVSELATQEEKDAAANAFHIKTAELQAAAIRVRSLFLPHQLTLQELVGRLDPPLPSPPLLSKAYTFTTDNEPAAHNAIAQHLNLPALRRVLVFLALLSTTDHLFYRCLSHSTAIGVKKAKKAHPIVYDGLRALKEAVNSIRESPIKAAFFLQKQEQIIRAAAAPAPHDQHQAAPLPANPAVAAAAEPALADDDFAAEVLLLLRDDPLGRGNMMVPGPPHHSFCRPLIFSRFQTPKLHMSPPPSVPDLIPLVLLSLSPQLLHRRGRPPWRLQLICPSSSSSISTRPTFLFIFRSQSHPSSPMRPAGGPL